MNKKPLGRKSYGSIAHLPNSRMGPADRSISEGQARIATEKPRDRHDIIIVQEKLDGSNVGVANIDGQIVALSRSGYLADTSPHEQHHLFNDWVKRNVKRFSAVLDYGERICGEWLVMAHGTQYYLPHEPFVAFDIMDYANTRKPFEEFSKLASIGDFVMPYMVSCGQPISVDDALSELGDFGKHGATEEIEGAIWRVERRGVVDFLCKYVRPEKEDGKYFGDLQLMNSWTPKKSDKETA